jgi:hypothetical protein
LIVFGEMIMTEVNHRRGTREKDLRSLHPFGAIQGRKGEPRGWMRENGQTRDRAMSCAIASPSDVPLSGHVVGASIGNDFTNGSRGAAKAVRGIKKYVRTRTRFHENAAVKKLARELD